MLQRLRGAVLPDEQGGIVIEAHAVDLPKVQMIGSQAAQRLVEHMQRKRLVPPMRTHFRHEENVLPASLQGAPHPNFALPPVILPAVIEKRNAAVDRLMDDALGGLLVRRVAEVMTTEPESRDAYSGFAK